MKAKGLVLTRKACADVNNELLNTLENVIVGLHYKLLKQTEFASDMVIILVQVG